MAANSLIRRAFTLIELLVVIAIIAILIAQRQRFDRRTIDAAQLFRRLRTIRPVDASRARGHGLGAEAP